MYVIGVTGGIGTGKSTVASFFSKMGLPVLDADQISHEVTEPGGAAVEEVVQTFGEEILDDSGNIDRQKLGSVVFRDKNKLDRLSAIVHCHVIETLQNQVKALTKKKVKACVLDVPIPVQEGFLDQSDHVILVWADEAIRLGRLAGRGMDEAEARRRISMQMTREEYAALANETVLNNGTLRDLQTAVEAIAERELRSRGIPLAEIREEDHTGE